MLQQIRNAFASLNRSIMPSASRRENVARAARFMVESLESRRLMSTAVWTGGANDGNNWNTPGNWQANAVPAAGESLEFPSPGNSNGIAINLGSNVTVGDITFDGAGYSITGASTVTVDGNVNANADGNGFNSALVLAHDTTVTVAASDTLQALGGISDGGHGFGITKQGAGTLRYQGSTTYTGATVVAGGDLELLTSIASHITVSSSGTLNGESGQADGITGNGGTVLLQIQGVSDSLTSAGNVALGAGSTLAETYDGSAGELVVTGNSSTINVTGSTLDLQMLGSATPAVGDVLTVISNQTQNPITGTFNGLPQGGTFHSDGFAYQISYTGGSGHDVTLTVQSVPAIWTSLSNYIYEWNDAGNWLANAVPGAGEDVYFPPTSGYQAVDVALASDVTVGSLAAEGSYNFSGSDISFDGNVIADGTNDNLPPVVLTHNTTFTVGNGAFLNFVDGISDGGQRFGITLQGAGFTDFGSPSTYTGATVLAQGSAEVDGASASSFTIDAGAMLYADDAIGGITGNGGTYVLGEAFAPYPSNSSNTGAISLGSGSTLEEAIGTFGNGEVDSELTASGSSINLTGATLEISPYNGFTPALGHVITLISNQTGHPVIGTFNGVPQGGGIAVGGIEYQVSYSAGQSGSDVTLTAVATAPTQLAIAQEPSSAAVAGQSIGTVIVDVADAQGNLETADDSNVTLTAQSAGVTSGVSAPPDLTLTGTTTVAAHNGVAVFSDLAITQSGNYTLTAADGSLTSAATTSITVAPAPTPPAPPANMVVAGTRVPTLVINPATAFPNSTGVSKKLTFVVHSASGSGAAIYSKTIRVVHGSAALRNLTIRKVGVYNVVISDSFGNSTTRQITVIAAKPIRLAFAAPVKTLNGSPTITVRVLDKYGNLSTASDGTTATLLLGPHPELGANPVLTGTLTATVANGVAAFSDVAVASTGRARVFARDGKLRPARSGIFVNR
jgi:fibronectin-binding autotransporter adhesin